MRLLVKSLDMRIGSQTVTGVQELASDFIRRRFSFVFPVTILYTTVFRSLVQPTSTKLS